MTTLFVIRFAIEIRITPWEVCRVSILYARNTHHLFWGGIPASQGFSYPPFYKSNPKSRTLDWNAHT